MIDYYDILRIPPGASEETIEERYYFLLGNLRGDAFSGGEADEHFVRAKEEIRLLKEAYEVLSDLGSRRRYDRARNGALGGVTEFLSPPPEELPSLPLTAPQPGLARPALATPKKSPRWHDSSGAGVLVAFVAGALIASGVLATKYWHTGLRDQQSFVARYLSLAQQQGEHAVRQPSNEGSAVTDAAGPVLQAGGQSNRIGNKGVTRVKLAQRRQALDAAEGQTGAVRKERPVSADIILAKGQRAFGAQRIGNVEVCYPDGTQDCWTTKGDCGQPHVAANGIVGWTVYESTRSGNYDFQPNGTLVLRRGGQIIQTINVASDYIDGWNFVDSGSKIVVHARGAPGGTVIERYDTATGRLLDSADAARGDLPSWALSDADR